MKLVILIGNTAVGKMSVGQELMKMTDLRLFHNHMTIEIAIDVFGDYHGKVVSRMREVIFEEFAATDNYGMIFTYMWAFDQQSNLDYIVHVSDIFRKRGAEIYYVELVAPQEVRLQRNISMNRLQHKMSKRDIESSQNRLLEDDRKYRCESFDGEVQFDNYIKIDNSNLSTHQVAVMIKEHFQL